MNDIPFILNSMDEIVQNNPLSGHTPGHKNGSLLPEALTTLWGKDFAAYDLTELPGLDNLHFSSGCIAQSQQQAAAIFGAKATYYLVNGTSGGLQAAIMTCCRKKQVFVPRHAHRSLYHSLILADADPIYLPITIDPTTQLPLGVDPQVLSHYMAQYPMCRHLIVINPTYHGFGWQNETLVALAKAQGLTVIVDEAHGSHLHFSQDLPPSLLDCGADIVVQSWHKTLPVLTQGSALHVGANYCGEPLDGMLSLLQTTSPSYLTMASLEAGSIWIQQWADNTVAQSLVRLEGFFEKLQTLSTIHRLWEPQWRQDPFKLYLISRCLTGPALAEELLSTYHIYGEMSDSTGCLLILPLTAEQAYLDRLLAALAAIDAACQALPPQSLTPAFYAHDIPSQVRPLKEAFFAPKTSIPWQHAAGHICGEFVIKYPPGIPICVPGEMITPALVDLWLSDKDQKKFVTILQEE